MNSDSNAVNLSLRYFRGGHFCSEAILRAFNEQYNLGLDEKYYKIASGFGSGMGESGCSCGAVTGSIMVLGLVAGDGRKCGQQEIVCEAVRELHDTFRTKHKSICCRILTKNVKWKSGEHKILCEDYVLDAAQITFEIINKKLQKYLVGTSKNSCAAILHSLCPHFITQKPRHKPIRLKFLGFKLRTNPAQSCVPLVFRDALVQKDECKIAVKKNPASLLRYIFCKKK